MTDTPEQIAAGRPQIFLDCDGVYPDATVAFLAMLDAAQKGE